MSIGHSLLVPALDQHYASASRSALLLDNVSAAPLVACSWKYRLRSTATRAGRVRRSSDSAEVDIGFSGNNVDTAAIATHCSGTSGFVRLFADQGAAARHAGNATAGAQPRIYSGGAVDVMTGGATAMYYPTAGATTALSTGLGSFSTTGNPGLTVGIVFDITSAENRLFEFGNGVSGQSLLVDAERDSTAGGREFFVSNRTDSRQFQYNGAYSVRHAMIIKIAASSQVSTWTVEENGSDLAQFALVGGAGTLNLTGAGANLVLGNLFSGADSINGHIAAYMMWAQLLGSGDLALLRAHLASYV